MPQTKWNESCAFQDSGITSTGNRARTSAKHYFPSNNKYPWTDPLTTLSHNVHKWALNKAVQRRMWVQKLWKCTLFFNSNRTGFPVNATFKKNKTFPKNKFQVTLVPMRQSKSSVCINTLPQNPNTSEFTNARMKEKQKAFCLVSCYMLKNYHETSK